MELSHFSTTGLTPEDIKKLKKFNWGAFFLCPIWTISNNMGEWKVISFIPVLGFIAAIYLGVNGNKLAYEKSNYKSVDDFIFIQGQWNFWGISVGVLSIIAVIIIFVNVN